MEKSALRKIIFWSIVLFVIPLYAAYRLLLAHYAPTTEADRTEQVMIPTIGFAVSWGIFVLSGAITVGVRKAWRKRETDQGVEIDTPTPRP